MFASFLLRLCIRVLPRARAPVTSGAPRAQHERAPFTHVHAAKKLAKLRYPFINPIKTIQTLRRPSPFFPFLPVPPRPRLTRPLSSKACLTPRGPRQDIIKSLRVRSAGLCLALSGRLQRNRQIFIRYPSSYFYPSIVVHNVCMHVHWVVFMRDHSGFQGSCVFARPTGCVCGRLGAVVGFCARCWLVIMV